MVNKCTSRNRLSIRLCRKSRYSSGNYSDFKISEDEQGRYAIFGSSIARWEDTKTLSVRASDSNTSIHTRIIDSDADGKFERVSSVTRMREDGLVLRYEIINTPGRYSPISWKAVWSNGAKKEDKTELLDESVEPYSNLIDLVKDHGL